MIPFATLKLALYNVVSTELDCTTIWADQSEVRPPRPYASLKLTSGPVVVANDEVRQPTSGSFEVAGLRRMTLSVQAFGEGALERMSRLQTALSKESVLESLDKSGVAIVEVAGVQNLTGLLDNRFETRAQMDVGFYAAENESDSTDFVESVEVTSEPDSDTFVVESI